MIKKNDKIITTQDILNPRDNSLMGLRSFSPRFTDRDKVMPCDNCKDRKDFLNRMFKGEK